MPKARTRQPRGTGRVPGPVLGLEPESLLEEVFAVRVTDPERAAGLRRGLNLQLDTRGDGVAVRNRGVVLGYLEPDGERWVGSHRCLSCVFEAYDTGNSNRFLVRIAARPR